MTVYWYRLEDHKVGDADGSWVEVYMAKLIVVKETPKG